MICIFAGLKYYSLICYDMFIYKLLTLIVMKNIESLNDSNGKTLYAYTVNGLQTTSWMKLSELEKTVKPEGAKIIKAFIPGEHF